MPTRSMSVRGDRCELGYPRRRVAARFDVRHDLGILADANDALDASETLDSSPPDDASAALDSSPPGDMGVA